MTIGPEFEAVLAAAQLGSDWAFESLYRDLNPRLIRYLSVQAPPVAEDVAAETWMGVARQLAAFTGGESAFRAWLFSIARRRLIQHWRDSGRRPTVPLSADAVPERVAPDDPEAAGLANVSAQQAVADIAAALSPDQADVVLLRILADLDVDQVAQILGKRTGTVRVLQHKALKRLAEKFSDRALTEDAPGAIGKSR